MFKTQKKEIIWGDKTLTIETGKVAKQADGAVVIHYGETTVLVAAVVAKSMQEGQNFFPLSVHYQEKYYAAGKIPGGFFKREGRPTERDTLISRLIDRPIRPLFPKEFLNEVQIIATVLSYDTQNDPAIPALIGASAAMSLSGAPFMGPVGAAQVGYIDGKFVLNPTKAEMVVSKLDLIVAGTREGVLMVESEAAELPEDIMLEAVMFGWRGFQPVIEQISELAAAARNAPMLPPAASFDKAKLEKKVGALIENDLKEAYALKIKQQRMTKISEARQKAISAFVAKNDSSQVTEQLIEAICKDIEANIVRSNILQTGIRIDDRDTKTIRPIISEVGILPRVHGSALFTRGETQALVVATLGTGDDEQFIDGLDGKMHERFMLHYNFPAYSVGETSRFMGTGRREIGHGKLAWRAIHPLLPEKEKFPYTLRVVSEITESNGSSSMATVCGTSLALMDAGVPLVRPVAGIAMGLIKQGTDFAVLSDILGDEDYLGDMDFKVAGTEQGVTALQMDIKITSVTEEIMKIALAQAKEGRLHILGEMQKALSSSRESLNSKCTANCHNSDPERQNT